MSGEDFLSRWSRLKRSAVKPPAPEPLAEAVPPPAAPLPDPSLPDAGPPVAADTAGRCAAGQRADEPGADVAEEDPLTDLPPVEELTADSDFTPFLRAEVPEDLHRQALRKLWTSDPVYANDDGLKDYADDYTGMFDLSEPVKTLYRVGRGFLESVEDIAEPAAVPPQAEGCDKLPRDDVAETTDGAADKGEERTV